jgi:hypothetical protein
MRGVCVLHFLDDGCAPWLLRDWERIDRKPMRHGDPSIHETPCIAIPETCQEAIPQFAAQVIASAIYSLQQVLAW